MQWWGGQTNRNKKVVTNKGMLSFACAVKNNFYAYERKGPYGNGYTCKTVALCPSVCCLFTAAQMGCVCHALRWLRPLLLWTAMLWERGHCNHMGNMYLEQSPVVIVIHHPTSMAHFIVSAAKIIKTLAFIEQSKNTAVHKQGTHWRHGIQIRKHSWTSYI